MNPTQEYTRWQAAGLAPTLAEELTLIAGNEKEISDRFYRHLEFGTGGLRGVIGAGTNRMNLYTVGRASQGLADYLNASSDTPSVCIAYDTRNMSREFATRAAEVFCANGVKTYIYDDVRPTPMLSFAVRRIQANAGIVITASHNPKEYNGYKVYGPDGGQITDEAAAAILAKINAVDVLEGVKTIPLDRTGLLSVMGEEVDSRYYNRVKELVLRGDLVKARAADLKILYSPLHGSGNIPVRRVLRELGFAKVSVVPEQEKPDGSFPTVPYPNPEEPAVYQLAIELAETENPYLIFATDPDCDRIGVLVKDGAGQFSVLTGNQVGALLCDYVITTLGEQGDLPANAAIVKTIVTTEMARAICEKHGVTLVDTLTGFKYIGEKIGQWEESGEHTFLLGFEESYGYLAGGFVRDKDAVIAAALIAEMALYYKEKGLTLYEAMNALYETYGYYAETLKSVTMPGAEGQQRIAEIIATLRGNYREAFAGQDLAFFEDYKQSLRQNLATGESEAIDLPKSNVLKFIFADGAWLVLRPSGTEPKMKMYLGVAGAGRAATDTRLAELESLGNRLLG